MKLTMRKKAFTLVEIMIVILIMGLLLSIAIPSFVGAREKSRRRACMGNLHIAEQAKEQWAMEHQKAEGAAVDWADLWPNYIRAPILPQCPSGGTYALQPIGTPITCTEAGHLWQ